ncbi:MAG: tetratricopeptide repeat protein [Thermoleophilia bacterium]|nr:tetratricopeptide repeat protein [Thermoleophilia bacterium]
MGDTDAYDAYTNGCALLQSREYHQAVVALRRARALEPDKASIREALGRAYAGMRDFPHAREEFQAAVDLHPTDGYAHFGLARCLDRLDEPVLARRHHRLAKLFGTGIS